MENYSIRSIKAIIGLGNPGQKYSMNRHNIGFLVVDQIADQQGVSWQSADKLEYAKTSIELHNFYLIKPQTFMNSSGQVVQFLRKKGIEADQILVVHDELEKKFGNISIKLGGSAKGHNGLRSIISVIGSDFWRLRFGIDRPAEKSEVGNYVLSNFSAVEQSELEQLILKTTEMILHQ